MTIQLLGGNLVNRYINKYTGLPVAIVIDTNLKFDDGIEFKRESLIEGNFKLLCVYSGSLTANGDGTIKEFEEVLKEFKDYTPTHICCSPQRMVEIQKLFLDQFHKAQPFIVEPYSNHLTQDMMNTANATLELQTAIHQAFDNKICSKHSIEVEETVADRKIKF